MNINTIEGSIEVIYYGPKIVGYRLIPQSNRKINHIFDKENGYITSVEDFSIITKELNFSLQNEVKINNTKDFRDLVNKTEFHNQLESLF